MLHYCSADDIKTIFAAAGRYDAAIENARAAVTDDFNRFMRRDLGYEENVPEVLDSADVQGTHNIWLLKKNIDPLSLKVWYARDRDFLNPDALLTTDMLALDPVKGKLTLIGNFRRGLRTIKIVYNGGYPPVAEGSDTMACPASVKQAAIDQAVYIARRSMGLNQGQSADDSKKGQIKQKPLVDGLLADAAQALMPYRRSLGY